MNLLKTIKFLVPLTLLAMGCVAVPSAPALGQGNTIRLNTIGYLPEQEKRASIAAPCREFVVREAGSGKTVLSSKVTGPVANADTGENLYTADFSALKKSGGYYLEVPGVGKSASFRIASDVYNNAFYTATRAMYLWRCGMAVSGKYGGDTFSQGACHREDAYMDFVGKPGERRDATGGWHDAGDYNKYIINAGVTVGVMLRAWEQFPNKVKSVRLNIPESGKGTPDFLAEIRYELDWVLKMQAPDGSVYHKVSAQGFGGFTLPEKETTKRFFTPWSSAATADFVAMTAQAARLYRPYDAAFAYRCLNAAKKSYRFLAAHPENQPANLKGFSTGEYQADDKSDRLWVAAELWETTGDAPFLKDAEARIRASDSAFDAVFDWGNCRNLGLITYLFSRRPGKDPTLTAKLRQSLIRVADGIVATGRRHGYGRPFGTSYYWGSNGATARQIVLLQTANRIAPNRAYIETALDALSYLLGRNYFGRSFVTGLGANPPMFPHDRRSGGDSVKNPWPGYLIGGGWPGAKDWKDEEGSYQTNEIAINWNGALIYALAGFVEPNPVAK